MANETFNYQCPACTGPLHFDGETGKLKCDYCDSLYTVEEMEALYGSAAKAAESETKAKEARKSETSGEVWDESGLNGDWGGDLGNMSAYNCTSCGAELLCEKTTAATACPYCGNPTIIPGKFSGALKPDYVIPFSVSREQAIEALHKHYGGKRLLPKLFSKENHIQEVQGMYVPFWLFDGEADADIRYHAVRTAVHETKREEIIETSHYELHRAGTVRFSKIPVDASKRMDDALMDSIEPFQYDGLKKFSLSYLPGYLADKYDCSVAECAKRADERATNTAHSAMDVTTWNYESVRAESSSIRLRRGKVHYALLPIWMLNTNWNGKQYTFAMNGQTGKLVGDLPVDKGIYWKYRMVFTAAIAGALYALQWIIALM